jgi:FMN phosphatase YigB (HAD superfamily)
VNSEAPARSAERVDVPASNHAPTGESWSLVDATIEHMTITGVLFDFSGTLFRIEPAHSWLANVLHEAGIAATPAETARYAEELEWAGALPGGASPRVVPPHLAELWATRDESAERHRAAYIGLAQQVELPDPRLFDALYERHMTPSAWQPYPDAADVMGELKRRGLAVGVISNIGWDVRPVFRAHGLDTAVDAFVLSFEHGVQKPDSALFRVACDALGHDPCDILMVGDDRHADGGAAAIGCAVHFVEHLPVEHRPDGLRPVLTRLNGLVTRSS